MILWGGLRSLSRGRLVFMLSKMGNVELIEALKKIKEVVDKKNIGVWLLGGLACAFYAGRLYREFGDIDLITKDKETCIFLCGILEEMEYKKMGEKNIADGLIVNIYENDDGVNLDVSYYTRDFGLVMGDLEENEKELEGVKFKVVSKRFCKSYKEYFLTNRNEEKDVLDLKMIE